MEAYTHVVQYYETDKMGITHHSNYIRFMEEARTFVLENAGFPYKKMEEEKIYIPTVSVSVDYKRTTTYGDEIKIYAVVKEMTAARVVLSYKMLVNEQIVCTASSVHCFLNESGRPVAIKKANEEIYNVFANLQAEGTNEEI